MKSVTGALLLAAVAATAWGQQEGGAYSIAGVVVDHASNRPLSDVVITIAPAQHMNQQTQQKSNEGGAFTFTNLRAGKYALWAQHGSENAQFYMGYEGFLTAIAVGPGLKSDGIVFPLTSGGAITGTVVDQDGDPVAGASVMLLHKAVSFGKSTVVQNGSQGTRPSGKFAFRNVEPGTYYVAVMGSPWYAEYTARPDDSEGPDVAQEGAQLEVTYPVTYYGDTDNPDAATPISVAEGSRSEIQISPRTVRASRLWIGNATQGPQEGFSINVMVKGPGGTLLQAPTSVVGNLGGEDLVGLAPGQYSLTVQRITGGKQGESWSENLSVSGDGEPQGQRSAASTVSGHLTLQAATGAGQSGVMLRRSDGFSTYCQTDVQGSFTCNQPLLPGKYELFISGTMAGIYIASLTAEGAKVNGSSLEIGNDASAVKLEITVALGSENVEGVAVRYGKPLAGAMILLLPENADRPELIRRDQSDSDGTFTLNAAVPGRYRLVAIDDGRELAYRDPAVMAPYLQHAMRVTLPLAGKDPVKVEVRQRQP